jgi:spermidine synthase
LREALAYPRVEHVTVAEIEPAIVGWHATHLAATSGGALDDARVTVVTTDVVELLHAEVPAYDEVLRRHFDDVRTLTVEVARGEPDVIWVARAP